MAYSVRMSQFREMSEEERAGAVNKLVRGALESANGQTMEQLEAEIREFERRYEITSEHLMEELYESMRSETADIARWLWLLDLRERTSRHQTR